MPADPREQPRAVWPCFPVDVQNSWFALVIAGKNEHTQGGNDA